MGKVFSFLLLSISCTNATNVEVQSGLQHGDEVQVHCPSSKSRQKLFYGTVFAQSGSAHSKDKACSGVKKYLSPKDAKSFRNDISHIERAWVVVKGRDNSIMLS